MWNICGEKEHKYSHYPLDFGGFYQGDQSDQQPPKAQYRKLGNYYYGKRPRIKTNSPRGNLKKWVPRTFEYELGRISQKSPSKKVGY